jgi:hypothetical protein
MQFSSATKPGQKLRVIAPICYDDHVVGVVDGKYLAGAVSRTAVTAIRLERRTSFKHPIVGLIVGISAMGISFLALAGDPTLATPHELVGLLFLFSVGAYLLWGVLRRRDEPWLVFVLGSSERAFPLKDDLSAEASSLLTQLCGRAPEKRSSDP